MSSEPFSNLLEGGVFAAQSGTQRITDIPDRYDSGLNLAKPELALHTSGTCGDQGTAGSWGTHRYHTSLYRKRGRSPNICVNDEFYVVENDLRNAIQQMKDFTREFIMADNRWQMLDLSGTKVNLQSGASNVFDVISGGTVGAVNVAFPTRVLPDSPLSMAFARQLDFYMRENLAPDLFGAGAGQYAVLITSLGQSEVLRNETGVATDIVAGVVGSFAEDRALRHQYAFSDYQYRGFKGAIDERPLRFNTLDANGYPNVINPYVSTAADTGTVAAVNPLWVQAQYEVSFLVYKNTFRRLVPERFTGEGDAKFPPQFVMGELKWHQQSDNDCNIWDDFGFFIWQIIRGIEPIKPYLCIPILHKRCKVDLGLKTCEGFTTTDITGI